MKKKHFLFLAVVMTVSSGVFCQDEQVGLVKDEDQKASVVKKCLETQCPICLGDFEDTTEVVVFECGHACCAGACYNGLTENYTKCPVCKHGEIIDGSGKNGMITTGLYKDLKVSEEERVEEEKKRAQVAETIANEVQKGARETARRKNYVPDAPDSLFPARMNVLDMLRLLFFSQMNRERQVFPEFVSMNEESEEDLNVNAHEAAFFEKFLNVIIIMNRFASIMRAYSAMNTIPFDIRNTVGGNSYVIAIES